MIDLYRLRDYHQDYYNGNYYRDVRYLHEISQHLFLNCNSYKDDVDPYEIFFNFLNLKYRSGRNGLLGAEISYYKTLDEYKRGNNPHRYSDRLFFDFDVDNKKASAIKKEILDTQSNMVGKKRREKIKTLQKEYRTLIFDEDLLEKPFKEATELCNHLQNKGINPYLIVSGSKGFHVNVFFNEMQLNQIGKISEHLATLFKKNLGLDTLDLAVNRDAYRRLQRVPYSINSKTGLYCQPLSKDLTYDEVIKLIAKKDNTPIKFDIQEYYAPDTFNDLLKSLNTDFNKEIKRESKRRNLTMNKSMHDDGLFKDVDLRDLALLTLGEPVAIYENRNTYCCPFHDDTHASAVSFENRFYCSTCGVNFNKYDFVMQVTGAKTKNEMLMKIKEMFNLQ